MNLEELQKEWNAVKSVPRSHDEIRRMMYRSPLSRLKRLTGKEILGFSAKTAVVIALTVLFDLFKSWSTAIFVIWSMLLLLNDYLGLRYLRFLPYRGGSIREELNKDMTSMKRVILLTRVIHGLIWLALVLILGLTVRVGSMNILLWAMILLPVLVALNWWTSRKWSPRLDRLKETLNDFSDDDDMPEDPSHE